MTNPSAPMNAHILVIDDEPDLRTLYELTLLREGYRVETAGSVKEARELLEQQRFDVVITDMRLPDGLGIELLVSLRAAMRGERCIVITAHGSAENAVESLKAGAFDYLTKPVDLKQFRAVVSSVAQDNTSVRQGSTRLVAAASAALPADPSRHGEEALARLVGTSVAMQNVKDRVSKVARSMAPVLVYGESGTGKELVAKALHANSHRANGPWVAVNCSAIPETLLETEFFGAKKGAYTGSTHDREGFFQAARSGTLFLDEIGETSPAFQVRVLRVLQEGEVRPVGAPRPVPVDVRVIAATHRDLEQRVQEGLFREDLYYRLAGVSIIVPPLRERAGDIAPIARRLVREVGVELGRPGATLNDEAMACLMGYPWPGNIRELRNEIARAVALSDGDEIQAQTFSLRVLHGQAGLAASSHASAQAISLPNSGTLSERLAGIETMVLRETLLRHRWNKTRAAKELGLSRVGLRGKMIRFGLED